MAITRAGCGIYAALALLELGWRNLGGVPLFAHAASFAIGSWREAFTNTVFNRLVVLCCLIGDEGVVAIALGCEWVRGLDGSLWGLINDWSSSSAFYRDRLTLFVYWKVMSYLERIQLQQPFWCFLRMSEMPEFNRIERMFQSHRVVVFVVVVRIMVARLCVFLCWQGRSGEALVWESSTSMRAEVVIKNDPSIDVR